MTVQLAPLDNAFATRFTRPGALPFFFGDDDSATAVVERFAARGFRGAIVGPHGSGKSTLVAELVPRLEAIGRRLRIIALHDGERRLPAGIMSNLQADDVLIVDGYEQLGWPARWSLHRAVHRSGAGLLVTTHEPIRRLPTLLATRPSFELTQSLVERLVAASPGAAITAADVRRAFDRHAGNVREVFFELYDLYELRRS